MVPASHRLTAPRPSALARMLSFSFISLILVVGCELFVESLVKSQADFLLNWLRNESTSNPSPASTFAEGSGTALNVTVPLAPSEKLARSDGAEPLPMRLKKLSEPMPIEFGSSYALWYCVVRAPEIVCWFQLLSSPFAAMEKLSPA